MKNISSMDEFINESGSRPLNEKGSRMLMKIGNNYDVFDRGDMEWREDMEYLGYASNWQSHFFRAYGAPGSKEIVIMEVPKKTESKDIM